MTLETGTDIRCQLLCHDARRALAIRDGLAKPPPLGRVIGA